MAKYDSGTNFKETNDQELQSSFNKVLYEITYFSTIHKTTNGAHQFRSLQAKINLRAVPKSLHQVNLRTVPKKSLYQVTCLSIMLNRNNWPLY